MRANKLVTVGVYVAATAVLAVGVTVLVKDRRDGGGAKTVSASDLPNLAPMPFPATVSVDGSTRGSVGTQFSVSATSFSKDPLARVDLYDGSRRVATAVPEAGSATAALTYPALSVGPHALYAVVTDTEGLVSRSPATVVDVSVALPEGSIVKVDDQGNKVPSSPPTDGAAATVSVPVAPEEGETGKDLAERIGVKPAQLNVVFAGNEKVDPTVFDPASVIPAGSQVVVAVAPDAGLQELEGKSAVVSNPTADAGADEMTLEGKADGCDVVLTSAGSDGKVSYFDGNSGVPGWASIGEAGGDGELRLTAPTPGVHLYFARTAKLTTQTVSVKVPLGCAGDLGWTGSARIIDGELYLPPAAFGIVYLYLQVDGKTGVRIPADTGAAGRAFNAGSVTSIQTLLPDLGSLNGSSAELSVWKASEFPVEVAKGSLKVPEGRSLVEIVGEPGAIDLSVDKLKDINPLSDATRAVLLFEDKKLTFRWDAASDRVDEVLWQVYSAPPSLTATPGSSTVLAAGISGAQPAADGSGKRGSFTLDTKDIPGHEEVAEALAPSERPPGQLTLVEAAVTPFSVLALKDTKVVSPVPANAALDEKIQNIIDLPEVGAAIYVQVTANPKAPAMGTSSNTVTVVLPRVEPPEVDQSIKTGISMKVDELTLDPGRAPQPDLVGCAEITLGPRYGDNLNTKDPRNAAHQVYRAGDGIYCYVPPAPAKKDDCAIPDYVPASGLVCEFIELAHAIEGQVLDALKSLYDVAAQGYNGAINGLVALASTFNPICIAAKEVAKSAAAACKTLTEAVARAVITSVLASFGLPPQLPSLAELEALANGELAVLAVALMKQAGVPCDSFKASDELNAAVDLAGGKVDGYEVGPLIADPCLAVANALLKEAKTRVDRDVTTKIAKATGLPDFPNLYDSGFSIKPIRETLPVPMQVRLTLSPVDPTVDAAGLVCSVFPYPTDKRTNGPKVPNGPEGFAGPFLPDGGPKIRITEEEPIDGKGRFSGTAAISNYFVSEFSPLSARLKDLDVTVSVRGDTGKRTTYTSDSTRCRDFEAGVTERVRPPD